MPRIGFFSLAALVFTSTAFSQQCRIQFDARVAPDSKPRDFDVKTSIFETDEVIGEGLKFSQVLRMPKVDPSLFDVKTIPIGVSISDKSIFNNQIGFRRCELLSEAVTGDDPSSEGVKTIHFSVQIDSKKKIDLGHEYQLAFMEDNDFSTNQWVLKTGTIAGLQQDPHDLVLMGNVKDGEILFTTPFTEGEFHNFALTLDFDDNHISVYYSKGSSPLQNVLTRTPNDLTGRGKFHFGMLKKGISGGKGDITKNAFQPSNIDEGIILGGIFQEDSIDGCVSTSP
ncbi:hypothetical protein GcC1_087027 [Golovinomyces cichoracearum]|uniref:Glycoside hydrolase 131 catalytic N-terminal domain-containing protein n=1 Tax=Golovinomyces cichoracearum TaxID=62708 RepID=A0A420IH66_9PEZI|nr:hypothetical protein GcC1_087027 [Golovinomyces cichoracearum]